MPLQFSSVSLRFLPPSSSFTSATDFVFRQTQTPIARRPSVETVYGGRGIQSELGDVLPASSMRAAFPPSLLPSLPPFSHYFLHFLLTFRLILSPPSPEFYANPSFSLPPSLPPSISPSLSLSPSFRFSQNSNFTHVVVVGRGAFCCCSSRSSCLV